MSDEAKKELQKIEPPGVVLGLKAEPCKVPGDEQAKAKLAKNRAERAAKKNAKKE